MKRPCAWETEVGLYASYGLRTYQSSSMSFEEEEDDENCGISRPDSDSLLIKYHSKNTVSHLKSQPFVSFLHGSWVRVIPTYESLPTFHIYIQTMSCNKRMYTSTRRTFTHIHSIPCILCCLTGSDSLDQ